ncbi:putative T1SS secreted agglutinin RTX [Erwinia phage vB_EamM_Yoloswag]|uniref:Putative T1SS secreted agglutinin RTX n=1 Tax=Erwinia phage vB_EamM_Yoloswag TaxID=1958956 RepID=A0A1S6L310_9CAUD|nr:virion structural protein [Erwinia phage vB_EamM_Yoloswag]AQT28571.1 putative T1SS secreted agglutinin RTX [Erwinia phage vB_EamM_Yoloswag]
MRTGNLQLLVGASIKNFRPEVLAADPDVASLVAGQEAVIWYNSTDKKYKYFDGTAIQEFGGSGGEVPEGIVTADGLVPMTADLTLSSTDQSASEETAAVSKGYMNDSISTAVGGKQDKFTGLTENGIVVAGADNTLTTSNVTAAELGYLEGVTSAVQTQLDSKLSRDNAQLSGDLNADGHKVTNLAAPTNANDAARKIDIDNALAGMNWQEDIDAVQTDATLQPNKAEGSRYVITDAANLHADFGTITDVANNAIVESDGADFHVVFDPAADRADGAIAWNHGTEQYVRFDGTAWANFGGMSSVTAGDGLTLDGNALNVQVDRAVTIVGNKVGVNVAAAGGVEINGTNELAVKLDGASLAAGADGVKIADGGVGFAQIAPAAFGNGITVDNGAFVVDAAALKTLGFIDATGGSVAALELTGDAADYTDASAVNKAYVDQAISAGGASGAAKTYVYDKTAAEDTAATVHTFEHNANSKYGVVTVYDDTGYQIIPDEVILVDENNVRVEITQAKKVAIVFVATPVAVVAGE